MQSASTAETVLQPVNPAGTVAEVAAEAAAQQASLLTLAVAALRLAGTKKTSTTTTAQPSVTDKQEKIISLNKVAWHDNADDCWIIIYDRVYDITNFLDQHPGGDEILLEYAGRDATCAFRSSGHSAAAFRSLTPYQIGILPPHERLFRNKDQNKSKTVKS